MCVTVQSELRLKLAIDATGEDVGLFDPLCQRRGEGKFAPDRIQKEHDRRESLLPVDDVEHAVLAPLFVHDRRGAVYSVEYQCSGVVFCTNLEDSEIIDQVVPMLPLPRVATLIVGYAEESCCEDLLDGL